MPSRLVSLVALLVFGAAPVLAQESHPQIVVLDLLISTPSLAADARAVGEGFRASVRANTGLELIAGPALPEVAVKDSLRQLLKAGVLHGPVYVVAGSMTLFQDGRVRYIMNVADASNDAGIVHLERNGKAVASFLAASDTMVTQMAQFIARARGRRRGRG